MAPGTFSRRTGSLHGPAPRAGASAVGVVLVLTILLLASLSGGPLGGRASAGASGATPTDVGAAAAAPSGPTSSAAGCSVLAADWAARDAPVPAPAVSPALQSPCVLSHDEAGLYLVSNTSRSAEQVQFTITLPGSGTSPASAYDSFWVGLWVAGVPCSYGGESYLRVELLPPYSSQDGVNGSAAWTVRAPVWDLVPAGSCDSQCSNDTAFFTLAGRSYCEDDAVLTGVGALNATAAGAFAPGDTLSLTLSGIAGGASPLAVYVNDTSNTTRDLAWNYSGARTFIDGEYRNATVTGNSITPFYQNASTSATGWTDALGLGFGLENCPQPTSGAPFPTACNSYNGVVDAAAPSPQVLHVASWNPTAHGYTNLYPFFETASSSGACSGNASAAPCADFQAYGGTGAYPTFAIATGNGGSAFSVGVPSAADVTTFGPLASEFPANGSASGLERPTVLSDLRVSATSNAVTVTVRATDPNGIKDVYATDWWCGTNNSRALNTTRASLILLFPNTPLDGNYSATFPTNAWYGNLYFWASATSMAGVASAPLYGNVSLTSGSGGCGSTAPPPPTLVSAAIQPTGGGYALNWSEPASVGVTHYVLEAQPSGGGGVSTFPFGNVTSGRIGGLLGNVSYAITVVAFTPNGLNSFSNNTIAVPTLYPLVALPPQTTVVGHWVNATQVGITANVTGGYPPFSMVFSYGDGTSTTVFTTSGDASVLHTFSDNYSGVARVVIRTTDSAGDATVAPALFIPVQATPLATPARLAVGDGFARFSWTAPPSPVPVLSYTIFWTTNASLAPFLASAWPSNVSAPGIHVATLSFLVFQWVLPLPLGTTVYAQVLAVNKYGDGLLPPEGALGAEPYLEAVVAGFSGGPIVGGLLGAAPYTDSFSATFTTGAGNSLANATYHFSDGAIVPAALAGTNGTYFANVSYTFVHPGPATVYLYALDAYDDLLLLTLDLEVTPGPSPVVAVTVAPTPVFVNSTVGFTANVSGGSGDYTENWSFGDGGNASGPTVTWSYENATTYLVTLSVTDTLWGGVTTETLPVTVLPIPLVEIVSTAAASFGEYRLTALVIGGYGNFTYTWLFDDGTQGTGPTVLHTWAAGSYTVTLQAKDAYGHTATATVAISVGYNSTNSVAPAAGYPAVVVYGLVGALVVVAVLAALLGSRSRRPPPPAEDEASGLPALPPVQYEEEGPHDGPG